MKNIFSKIIIFSLLIFSFQSCVKDTYDFDKITNPKWNPALCAHVVHSVLTMRNFYKSDTLREFREDKNRLISIIFRNPVFTKTAQSILTIPDQDFTESFPDFKVNFNNNISTVVYPRDYTFKFPNGAEIDSITLDTVMIQIHYDGTIPYKGKINAICPSVKKNKDTLNMNFRFEPGITKDTTISLYGYTFVFDNSSGLVKNKLHFRFLAIAFKDPSSPTNDTNTYSFNTNIHFANAKYKGIYGYLGQQNFNVSLDSINIALFGTGGKWNYHFVDPKLNLKIKSTVGMPINVDINRIAFKNDNDSVLLKGTGIPNPWKLKYPTIPGKFDTTNLFLNNINSNIDAAINIIPTKCSSNLAATTNPYGNIVKNFILKTSSIDATEEVELPLYGNASGFTLQDTIAFNYNDLIGDNGKYVDYINFLFNAQNGFPVEGKLQIYLTDSLYHLYPPVDSLFHETNNTVTSAVPSNSPDYKATIPMTTFKKVSIPKERLLLWQNVKHMIIRVSFATYKNADNTVKIYGDNNLTVDFGFQSQLNVQSKK